MSDPKSILVPTDFSTYSDAALKKAVELAEKFNSKIYLLHVIDKAIQQCAVDYCITQDVVNQLEEQGLKASNDNLREEANKIIGAKKSGCGVRRPERPSCGSHLERTAG